MRGGDGGCDCDCDPDVCRVLCICFWICSTETASNSNTSTTEQKKKNVVGNPPLLKTGDLVPRQGVVTIPAGNETVQFLAPAEYPNLQMLRV